MNYTKGEWTVGRELDTGFHAKLIAIGTDYFRDGGFDFICYVNDTKEAKANAQLIASAPRMAKVLEKLCDVGWNTDDESYDEIQEVVEEAYQIIHTLAKAEAKNE